MSRPEESLEDRLNRDCFCMPVDRARLTESLDRALADEALVAETLASRPHLFADTPVFLSRDDLDAMLDVVAAVEATAALPGYVEAAMAWAPPLARHDFGPRGAFMGYDFHLGAAGPRLIEINTNAGGALLNAYLARAQNPCCQGEPGSGDFEAFEAAVWAMFQQEWRLQGRTGQPGLIAIVDEQPAEQYLYPEFVLASRLFERNGARAVIVDPRQLDFSDGRLSVDGQTVDLVYNRLTDFALETPASAALRGAYEAGAVVVTPNPRNHALLADKRDLTLFTDPVRLAGWGLAEAHRKALAAAPRTVLVTPKTADALWARRKGLFFKPAHGHGGKAVYRGDKLTRGVWADILAGVYVAQDFVAPTERMVTLDGVAQPRKLDVRLYTYAGRLLIAAARLYQGQTTNFRTPGGGFAPVLVTPPDLAA